MKAIINGKRYDTDTAEFVHGWSNGRHNGDFKYLVENLYKTKSGIFFLHGDGGAMTAYATDCGDTRCEGEKIIPMEKTEAMKWLESRSCI